MEIDEALFKKITLALRVGVRLASRHNPSAMHQFTSAFNELQCAKAGIDIGSLSNVEQED